MTESPHKQISFKDRMKDPDSRPGIVLPSQIEKTLISFLETPVSKLKSDVPDTNYTKAVMNVLWKYYSSRENSIMRVKDWIYLAMICIRSGTEIDPEWFHEKLDIRIAQTLDPAIHALFYYPSRVGIRALGAFLDINSECLLDFLQREQKFSEYQLPDHTIDDMIEPGLEDDIDGWISEYHRSVITPDNLMRVTTDYFFCYIHNPARMLEDRDYLISLVESTWISLFYDFFGPIYQFAERRGVYDKYKKNTLWDEG